MMNPVAITPTAYRIETYYRGGWHLTDMANSLEWAIRSQTYYEYTVGTPARIVPAMASAGPVQHDFR